MRIAHGGNLEVANEMFGLGKSEGKALVDAGMEARFGGLLNGERQWAM